jgi:hypothetical protein
MTKSLPEYIVLLMSRIDTHSCQRHFIQVIREYIGPGQEYDYQAAADALGLDYRTVQSYVLGENMPPLAKFLRMCALFGPVFVNRIISIAGMDGATIQNKPAITDFELNAEVSSIIGVLGQTLSDGRIDDREGTKVEHVLRHFLPHAQAWLARREDLRMGKEADHV